jgi:hypothetical protein
MMRKSFALAMMMVVGLVATVAADDTPPVPAPEAPTPEAPTPAAPTPEAPTPVTPPPQAEAAIGPTIVTGRVTDVLGRPIANARVYVLPRRGQPIPTKTQRDGRYSVEVQSAGTHGVVIAIDKAHTFRTVLVQRGTTNTMDVDIELDTQGGEVIKIEDKKRAVPAVQPKPKKDVRLSLPYSDEAVERDAWARAWLLLDVDERGAVTRLKLLKRPGFDLDKICIEQAFELRFDPARDASGQPMKTYMLWTFEWPAWGWLIQGNGIAVRRPRDTNEMHAWTPNREATGTDMVLGVDQKVGGLWARPNATANAFEGALDRVPCAGSGPLNLDLRNRAYRDCSQPDLSVAEALPWITRETAETALAELSNPNLVLVEEVQGSRVPTFVAAGVTGLLAIAAGVSVYKFANATDRVAAYTWQATIDPDAYAEHTATRDRWGKRALGLTAAAILAGGATLLIWHRNMPKRSFSVQPSETGKGAQATLQLRW